MGTHPPDNMRPSSFLVLAVLLVLGMLVGQAAVSGEADQVLDKGQGPRPDKGPGPVKVPSKVPSKPGSCPNSLIVCPRMDPPDACMMDSECTGNKKCCMGTCGRICTMPEN